MKTVVKPIAGNWHAGYTLDKHTVCSTPIGENEQGHMQFETLRTDVGEAVYQLKYRHDHTKALVLATAVNENLMPRFENVNVIIPMAASTIRPTQPVHEVVAHLAGLTGLPWYRDWLVKVGTGPSLKNIQGREARQEALQGALALAGDLQGTGPVNVLLVDDLYQTGASIEAACAVLGTCARVQKIYVAALTRKY